jgi:hypothetical protein
MVVDQNLRALVRWLAELHGTAFTPLDFVPADHLEHLKGTLEQAGLIWVPLQG